MRVAGMVSIATGFAAVVCEGGARGLARDNSGQTPDRAQYSRSCHVTMRDSESSRDAVACAHGSLPQTARPP